MVSLRALAVAYKAFNIAGSRGAAAAEATGETGGDGEPSRPRGMRSRPGVVPKLLGVLSVLRLPERDNAGRGKLEPARDMRDGKENSEKTHEPESS
jgi:hypothetical protein